MKARASKKKARKGKVRYARALPVVLATGEVVPLVLRDAAKRILRAFEAVRAKREEAESGVVVTITIKPRGYGYGIVSRPADSFDDTRSDDST